MKRFRAGAWALILILICVLLILAPACGSSGGSSDGSSGGKADKTGETGNAKVEQAKSEQTKGEQAKGVNPNLPADASPIIITELDLEDLLSKGLPVILNFGDDSPASKNTLATLAIFNRDIGDIALIRSVDLTSNPSAKEGFPVPILPTQFFYMADGKPITLPIGIGVILSSYNDLETMETVFTAHEGDITFDELIKVLSFMGVISLQ